MTTDLTVPVGLKITFASTLLAFILSGFTTIIYLRLGKQARAVALVCGTWSISSLVRCITFALAFIPEYVEPFVNAKTPEEVIAANVPTLFDASMWVWTFTQVFANTSIVIIALQLFIVIILPQYTDWNPKIFSYGLAISAVIGIVNPVVTVAVGMSPRYTPSIVHSACVWVNLCFSTLATFFVIVSMIYRRLKTLSVLGSSSLSNSLIIRIFIACITTIVISANSTYSTYQHGRFDPVLINLYEQYQQPYEWLTGSFGGTGAFLCFCTSKEAVRYIRRMLGLKELKESEYNVITVSKSVNASNHT